MRAASRRGRSDVRDERRLWCIGHSCSTTSFNILVFFPEKNVESPIDWKSINRFDVILSSYSWKCHYLLWQSRQKEATKWIYFFLNHSDSAPPHPHPLLLCTSVNSTLYSKKSLFNLSKAFPRSTAERWIRSQTRLLNRFEGRLKSYICPFNIL